MRRLAPALVLLLAACGPTTGTPAPAGSPGASGAPATTAPTAAASAAATGPVSDLATRFPIPGANRHMVYNWTTTTKSENKAGTDDVTYSACSDTSCSAFFNRTEGGTLTRSRANETPGLADGVVMPVVAKFMSEVVDLKAAIAKGGTTETVTVPAGTFTATKYTYGGSTVHTFWVQKPWVLKATIDGPDEKGTLELQKLE